MPNLDHPQHAYDRATFEARMETLGEETVRDMLAMGEFPHSHNAVIREWLARKRNDIQR